VRAAPLTVSLAATATDPDHADASLLDVALASGFLRRGTEGSLLPGAIAEIWQEDAAAEMAGLALDVLGAVLAQLTQDEETAEEFPGENLLPLYFLYERAGIPQSLAWQAAVAEEWILSPEPRPHRMSPLRPPGLTSCPPSRSHRGFRRACPAPARAPGR